MSELDDEILFNSVNNCSGYSSIWTRSSLLSQSWEYEENQLKQLSNSLEGSITQTFDDQIKAANNVMKHAYRLRYRANLAYSMLRQFHCTILRDRTKIYIELLEKGHKNLIEKINQLNQDQARRIDISQAESKKGCWKLFNYLYVLIRCPQGPEWQDQCKRYIKKITWDELSVILGIQHGVSEIPPLSHHGVISDNKGDHYIADIHRSDYWDSCHAEDVYRFPSDLTAPVHFRYSEEAKMQASYSQVSIPPEGNEFQQFVGALVSYCGLGSGYLVSVSKDQVVFHRTTDGQEYNLTINNFLANGSFVKIQDANAFENVFHKRVMWQGRLDRPHADHWQDVSVEYDYDLDQEIDVYMDDNFYIGDGDEFRDLNN